MNKFEEWAFRHKNCGGQLRINTETKELARTLWECETCHQVFDYPKISLFRQIILIGVTFWIFHIIFPLTYLYWSIKDRKKND